MATERMCGTMPLHFEAVEAETGYAQTRRMEEALTASLRRAPLEGIVRIPVAVHVVAAREEFQVSDEQINRQIEVLNQDFRALNQDRSQIPQAFAHLAEDAQIEFALATRDPAGRPTDGIIRKQTTIERFPAHFNPNESLTLQIARELMLAGTGSVAWPTESYLNIWVCNMSRNPLGFAAFPGSAPWRDGVVIDYTCFGVGGTARPDFDLGRTATHEVGHWLNLLHIWGDDGNMCTRSDNVDDTPNQAGANYGTPTYPSISCNNAPHGDLFMNFMDYVNDSAMIMFSRGQVERMRATLQGNRSGLLRSKGLAEPEEPAQRATAKILAANAFGREGQAAEEVFDGVDWVSVGDGESE
ncbi:zinc metalloprotease [Tsuneonella flava]|uniref:zinc metalloprotease n=1 Tax=Tsuneonella flava TaxID=2055955 RepID=UPI000C80082B|nr:zinc metalloprotease [Tsuneonella flava]